MGSRRWLLVLVALSACGTNPAPGADAGTTKPPADAGSLASIPASVNCGNGRLDAVEACDGAQIDQTVGTCDANWLGNGTVRCNANCTLDVSGCEDKDYCHGNGFYGDMATDPTSPFTGCDACELMGGHADPDCDAYCGADGHCASWYDSAVGAWSCEITGHGHDPDCGECGNGVAEGHEYCDGSDWRVISFNGTTGKPDSCEAWGYTGGTLKCAPNCTPDFTGCLK